mmetsp:Transcript_33220/g.95864  ORF Transcript_33220/g.95864 Transcript_33220/m.95864 type:complete len:275 (+) Transcript_33220:528-1352(+)
MLDITAERLQPPATADGLQQLPHRPLTHGRPHEHIGQCWHVAGHHPRHLTRNGPAHAQCGRLGHRRAFEVQQHGWPGRVLMSLGKRQAVCLADDHPLGLAECESRCDLSSRLADVADARVNHILLCAQPPDLMCVGGHLLERFLDENRRVDGQLVQQGHIETRHTQVADGHGLQDVPCGTDGRHERLDGLHDGDDRCVDGVAVAGEPVSIQCQSHRFQRAAPSRHQNVPQPIDAMSVGKSHQSQHTDGLQTPQPALLPLALLNPLQHVGLVAGS